MLVRGRVEGRHNGVVMISHPPENRDCQGTHRAAPGRYTQRVDIFTCQSNDKTVFLWYHNNTTPALGYMKVETSKEKMDTYVITVTTGKEEYNKNLLESIEELRPFYSRIWIPLRPDFRRIKVTKPFEGLNDLIVDMTESLTEQQTEHQTEEQTEQQTEGLVADSCSTPPNML